MEGNHEVFYFRIVPNEISFQSSVPFTPFSMPAMENTGISQDAISKFVSAYTNVIQFDARITPKVLCVIHHIQQFCEKHSAGLGLWSQQSTDSLHLDFEKTWMRYKVSSLNPFYRSQLLKVDCDCNCKHATK